MLKVLSANLWATVREKAKHAEQCNAAIAYVTNAGLLEGLLVRIIPEG